MKAVAVIPARMGSSRFPGKPLARLLGRPMIEHVYRRVSLCASIDAVYVATCDQAIVDAHTWHLQKKGRKYGDPVFYVSTNVPRADKSYTSEKLHRLIMDASKGVQVDHINGETLDNRRSNLRLTTNRENSRNITRIQGAVPFKGVCYHKRRCRFEAGIKVDYKTRKRK